MGPGFKGAGVPVSNPVSNPWFQTRFQALLLIVFLRARFQALLLIVFLQGEDLGHMAPKVWNTNCPAWTYSCCATEPEKQVVIPR